MTTEATENVQPTQPPIAESLEIQRTLGRLEAEQTNTKEQLIRLDQRMEQRFTAHEQSNAQQYTAHEHGNAQQFIEVNRCVDRLWYTIVGFGLAILAGIAGLAIQNALIG